MDQSRKKLLSGFLSRSGTERSFQTSSIARTGTDLSALEISDDKKGALGLTTLYNPLSPASAVADIVFIHGLGGGSRKTWSYSTETDHYWPLTWLPADPDFSNVRIHTFGYKADWDDRRQSILDIHDFAQSLISELRNHPGVRRESTRIILVGHSMGGCVAKKAYVLARQDQSYKDLAGRMHSIFFLGTPHRGSDMAAILENMLTAAWGKKPFVNDLTPNSTALNLINDAFRHVAPDLRLWSFYETLPVKAGLMNKIVVERHSATLGYHNEEIAAMNADHRHVCKFASPADPNYKMLRNALHTAIDLIRVAPLEPVPHHGTINSMISKTLEISLAESTSRLRSFLGVNDTSESDLVTLQGLREPGSCLWFTEKPSYISWKAGKGPGILWLTGRPAAGKSIISSQVIDQLKPPHAYCSFFLFRHSVTGKSTLGDCFRSLAFQMAMQDDLVKEALLQLEEEGMIWDKTEEVNVWGNLFTGSIFKLPSISQHFWVIDGIDECSNFNALFSKRFLATLPVELRLFATSRDLEVIERGITSLGLQASLQTLMDSDTLDDMRLFLTKKLTELDRLEGDDKREAMCEKILKKSRGSFLWVRLVLQEFENVWTEEAMDAVLSEIPEGLHDIYSRMVQSIEGDQRKAALAKSILTWVVLASRPLTLDELRCAVKLELNQNLQNIGKAIPTLCGQLAFIDKSGNVHMIHETAREFLLGKNLVSGIAIQRRESHGRLGFLLLRYLSSNVLKPSQMKTQNSAKPRGFAKSTSMAAAASVAAPDRSLLDYASSFFSEHIYRGSSESNDLMEELYTFLKTNNVLSWIEYIAKKNDLNAITRTAMNLRGYLGRRAKYYSPMDPSFHLADGWVTDLIRVAAKFRPQLLACPSSIHYLIPPLCPPLSTISKTFVKDARPSMLVVKGLPPGTWDDCLIRMDFEKGQTTSVSHGDRFFAVGLSTGRISIYDPNSVQRVLNLTHPERVKILEFSRYDKYLASCGAKHLIVWELKSGTKLHSFPLQSSALGVTFLGVDELLCAFQSSQLTKWNLETGEHDSISWNSDEGDDNYYSQIVIPDQPPISTAFFTATDDVLLAVGYRNHSIIIWNALELQPLGQCAAEANNGIDDMIFNPNPEIVALIVAYKDGRLCVFDYKFMTLSFSLPNVFAHSIACSSDGRSIIVGCSTGIIEVFEFDQDRDGNVTLTPIYRIDNDMDDSVRGIAFSSDGLRFVDIRGQQCRVWAPAALVRNSELESISDAVTLPPMKAGMLDGLEDPEITSPLAASANSPYVVAGKRDGTVALFSTGDGKEIGVLYRHARGASVVVVVLGEPRKLIISADDSGRVLAAEIGMTLSNTAAAQQPGQKLSAARIVLDRRFRGAVAGLLTNTAADRLLVRGRIVDEMWELPSGRVLPDTESSIAADTTASQPFLRPSTPLMSSTSDSDVTITAASTRSAFQHPVNPDWFVIVSNDIARVYAWTDFEELTSSGGIRLQRPAATTELLRPPQTTPSPPLPDTSRASITASYHVGHGLVVELLRPSKSAPPRLYAWPGATFDPHSPEASAVPTTEPRLDIISPAVLYVLGFTGTSTLMFLDINLWVCSTDLESAALATVRGSGAGGIRPLPAAAHARRHFFALSEWRTAGGELICTLGMAPTAAPRRGTMDVAFASRHRLIVVKGGMEFSESVIAGRTVAENGQLHGGGSGPEGGGANGQHFWAPL